MSGRFRTDTLTGTEAVRAQRARILTELLDDVQDLADAGAAAIRAEVPTYAAQGGGFHADVRDQIVRHYRAKLAVLLEERPVTAADIAFVRRAAMRRARAGVPLADYVNAYRIGQRVFWESLVERAGPTPAGREAALSLAVAQMRYCDFASAQAAYAYMEFQQYAAADSVRESRGLLETLLAGGTPTRGRELAAAQAHGLAPDARTPLLVVVAMLVEAPAPEGAGLDRDAEARHAACAALARTGGNGARTLSVVRQSEIVAVPVLGPGAEAGELCDRLQAVVGSLAGEGIRLAMGVSTPMAGPAQIPQAYQEARAVLDFVPEDGGVAALPRITPFQYLALRADDTARHLVDPRVTALLEEDRARGGVLTATIRAFAAADLNLRTAAERLQIHPNTAQYRMRRIQQRTGRSLRSIEDLVELLVAIALQDAVPTNDGRERLATVTDEGRRRADVRSSHEPR
ncbi:carbohydrate diacid transcriptional activator CdaR [Nonomuraea coxensis DSM 45129]|uniref:Carbohydrate diacid transcriptional activator CdaR n=1 Tax=Nonomuraea coxensis DSM 45129 TaxID=1122611 RepID=A0ABX8UH52_9ACTN|nr:helix-turn-helix domain-containing protein [Nonomuraea coxensis]QYC45612.1 carbohydrate diacid transcriptional activator CdaR [Nonomuraea coxensis DSM 45129]